MSTSPKKAWSGRFRKKSHPLMDAFNRSLAFDQKLYAEDIQGSLAHAKQLGKIGVLTAGESNKLCSALKKILAELEAGSLTLDQSAEDVHMAVEAELTRRVGALGAKLHTGRSRNDQVALDLRLYCQKHLQLFDAELKKSQTALLQLAETEGFVALPGYTHLQRAQPILWAHHLLAYVEMFQRDRSRLQDCLGRTTHSPLGAGAIAGSTFPLDRVFTAREVGFSEVMRNSLDAVSDRDFVVEFLFALSLLITHLSRFAEEMVLWNSQEFDFIKLPEAFCTGSSMMPQKINPDAFELIRGKTGRIHGHLFNLLVLLKGLPLAYNKDMQEDKPALFDAVEQMHFVLEVFNEIVPELRPKAEKMSAALKEGFVLATDLADYLVTKNIPFRQAHELVGELVQYCVKNKKGLEDLSLTELQKFSPKIDKGVFAWLTIESSLAKRDSLGGTSPRQVKSAIKELKRRI